MPRILIAWPELLTCLGELQPVELDGAKYVDGLALLEAVQNLVGPRFGLENPVMQLRPEEHAGPPPWPYDGPGATVVEPLELERRRLAALPLGDCALCHHYQHDGGRCVECDCDNYIDSVNRDPVVELQRRGEDVAPDTSQILPAVTAGDADVAARGLFTKPPIHDGPPIE